MFRPLFLSMILREQTTETEVGSEQLHDLNEKGNEDGITKS